MTRSGSHSPHLPFVMALFADSLTKILEENEKKRKQKAEALARQWQPFENKVLDKMEELLKQECTKAAQQDKTHYTFTPPLKLELLGPAGLGLETLTKLHWTGLLSSRIGTPVTVEAWWYGAKGIAYTESSLQAVSWAAVHKHLCDKLVKRIAGLGFQQTEKLLTSPVSIKVSWRGPAEPPAKRARTLPGNVKQECGICKEKKSVMAAVPCGHLACRECLDKASAKSEKCPFCNQCMTGTQVLFKP